MFELSAFGIWQAMQLSAFAARSVAGAAQPFDS
jgi:hypothetical protein